MFLSSKKGVECPGFLGGINMTYSFCGKAIRGRFAIPSGIVTTHPSTIELIANTVPEIGIVITKSIGLVPRTVPEGDEVLHPKEGIVYGCREPIIAEVCQGTYTNAVRLTNPGAKAFAEQLSGIKLPSDVFLLASVFGKNLEEFVETAKILAPYVDGLELNKSCPHSAKEGQVIGGDPDLVRKITAAVKQATGKPVVVKLSPNVDNLEDVTRAALAGGADAISGMNTRTPREITIDGYPVLTNIKGGVSGREILEDCLDRIKRISDVIKAEKPSVQILAGGGIRTAADVQRYLDLGADGIAIGSALAGLSTDELRKYFHFLPNDLEHKTNRAEGVLRDKALMQYEKFELVGKKRLSGDLAILTFDRAYVASPGKFVFAWLPGIGEKPFAVLDDMPLTLAVERRGYFTDRFIGLMQRQQGGHAERQVTLNEGDNVYIRGPCGNAIDHDLLRRRVVLVGGGTGIAALYSIARAAQSNPQIFIGAKDKQHLFYLDQLARSGNLHVATEERSQYHQGLVTDLLPGYIGGDAVYFNCGPKAMLRAAEQIELKLGARPDQIFSSEDYLTRCGVGLCGSCASPAGYRSCVDGPFMPLAQRK